MAQPQSVTLEELTAVCEKFYETEGFVTWSVVAREFGVSRQAVYNRLKKAVATGALSEDTLRRWESASARRAASRYNRELSHKCRLVINLSPENADWLEQQCQDRGITRADIINGLVNRARG